MADAPLTKHPETGQPVRRVLLRPGHRRQMVRLVRWPRSVADDKKLDRLGFTKYVKSGDGTYEKRAGKGPDVISRDKPISADDV